MRRSQKGCARAALTEGLIRELQVYAPNDCYESCLAGASCEHELPDRGRRAPRRGRSHRARRRSPRDLDGRCFVEHNHFGTNDSATRDAQLEPLCP